MGIKDLNKIFTEDDKVDNQRSNYDNIVIDGSNMVYIILAGVHGNLLKTHRNSKWPQTVDMNLFEQIDYIVNESTKLLITRLSYYLRNSDVYFVMDPLNTVYILDENIKYNTKYKEYIPDHQHFDNNQPIILNIKAAEQEKRKTSTDKAYTLEYKQKEFNRFTEFGFQQIHADILYEIYKQVYCFNDPKYLLKLSSIVLENVDKYFKSYDKQLHIIQANDEADLVIKNISVKLPGNVLVLSADADYCVLFADCPNVDVGPLNKSDRGIVNPHRTWKRILGDIFSYDMVLRIAPLLGNDYTVKMCITTSTNLIDFINLITDYNKLLSGSTKKTIYKVAGIRAQMYPEGILTVNQLDDIIHEYSKTYKPEYFKCYNLSNIIYANWDRFGRYELYKFDVTMSNILYDTLTSLSPDKRLYLPDLSKVVNDWNGLFQTLQFVLLNTPEECLLYYNYNYNKPIEDETEGWV